MRYIRMQEDHDSYAKDQLVWVEDDTAAKLVGDQIANDITPPLMQVTMSQPHDLYRPGQVIWLDEAKANALIERQRATRLVTSRPLTRVTFLTKVEAYNAGETAGFAPERARCYVEQRQAFYAGPPVMSVRFTTDYDLYKQGEDVWLMETVAKHYIQSGLAEHVEPDSPPMMTPAAVPQQTPLASSTLLATMEPASPAAQEQTSANQPLTAGTGVASEVVAQEAEHVQPAARATAGAATSPRRQQATARSAPSSERQERG